MKPATLLLGVVGLIAGCGASKEPRVSNAWIRLPPPSMAMTAAYFDVENPSSSDMTLVAVTGDGFGSIEMHRTETVDGKARMVEQNKVTVPGGGSVRFEPGGLHLMLMGFDQTMEQDQRFSLTLHWQNGGMTAVQAEVRRHAPE